MPSSASLTSVSAKPPALPSGPKARTAWPSAISRHTTGRLCSGAGSVSSRTHRSPCQTPDGMRRGGTHTVTRATVRRGVPAVWKTTSSPSAAGRSALRGRTPRASLTTCAQVRTCRGDNSTAAPASLPPPGFSTSPAPCLSTDTTGLGDPSCRNHVIGQFDPLPSRQVAVIFMVA